MEMDMESPSGPKRNFQFRYVAYTIILVINYQETFTRFGLPMTMVAGLVKKNCSDPLDNGTYCWSEDVKASAIGAFFYTYTLQAPVTWFASKIGFILLFRVYILGSGLITFGMPWFASISPYCVIFAQAVRGLLGCILISNNFNFVRYWTIPSESGLFLATSGSVLILGSFSGQMLAGLVSAAYSWEYYFYICGVMWAVLLVLHSCFVQTDVQQSRFFSDREKALYPKPDSNEEECKGRLPLSQIFRKVYLYSFCGFILVFNYSFYNAVTVFPFYLSEIMKFSTEECSYILLGIGIAMAGNMILLSKVYPIVDRYIPWIRSRQLFTFAPLVLQAALYIALPNVESRPFAVLILCLLSLTCSTLYAGSICTLNYELDPVNSAVIVSIFNSVGQLSGFFGPWFREKITTTDMFDPNYDEVYKGRWAKFFYISSVAPVIGIFVVWLAMVVRPSEWKLSPLLEIEEKSAGEKKRAGEESVIENRAAEQVG